MFLVFLFEVTNFCLLIKFLVSCFNFDIAANHVASG